MHFTNIAASALLFAASTLAAPTLSTRNYNTTSTNTTTTAAAPAPAAPAGLSLTQQLFLADTAVNRFALLPNDAQFVFDFNNPALKGKGGAGGDLIVSNRASFPALVSTGMSMAVGFLGPCGFNTPHIHPRATELQIVTSGRLVVEMVPENGVFVNNQKAAGRRVITNTLATGMMTPFYMGSVHTQFNPDCEAAEFVAAFNSEDFGGGQVAEELFAMSADVVEAAFGQAVDGAQVDLFRKAIPASIARGVEECLVKCGIKKV
jgi:hypothetical protein